MRRFRPLVESELNRVLAELPRFLPRFSWVPKIEPPRHLVTSLAVVCETYSWFLHRMGEDAARRFRLALDDLPRLRLLPLDAEHHHEVTRKLEARRGHKLTYVDASALVHLGKLGISVVWGGDRDLAVEGAHVLP